MGYSRQALDPIRRADSIRVMEDYITLKPAGREYRALCPFHPDKRPSFYVNPSNGLYLCRSCGEGGGRIGFVRKIGGFEFQEAVQAIASKCGIPLPANDGSYDYSPTAKACESVRRLSEWANEFFESELQGPAGAMAREYLTQRGVTDETRKLFRIGFAPDRWDGLLNYLRGLGATADELESSGLVVCRDSGGFYDRFRGRVTFPIDDSEGRLIAFGARVLDDSEPKYLNSPETAIYTKGRNLYGLALAKKEIRRLGHAIFVEGYTDCIMCHQAGIRNVVAPLGISLTDEQARLLRRYMDPPQVVVAFDPDGRGVEGAIRAIDKLHAAAFEVKIVHTSTGKDPAALIHQHGPEAFRSLLRSKIAHIPFVIDTAIAKHGISSPGKKQRVVDAVLPFLAQMPNIIERADNAHILADRLGLDARDMHEALNHAVLDRATKVTGSDVKRDKEDKAAAIAITVTERQLLEAMLADESTAHAIVANLADDDYADLEARPIFAAIVHAINQGDGLGFDALADGMEGAERELLLSLMMSNAYSGDDEDVLFTRAAARLSSLLQSQKRRALGALQGAISEAERSGNHELAATLCQEMLEARKAGIRAVVKPTPMEPTPLSYEVIEDAQAPEFASKEQSV